MISYFIYFQVYKSESIISSPYNSRLDLYAEHVIRGDILSADGKTLATTKVSSSGKETREYPYKNMFAHVVGYMTNGKAGIESSFNFNLLRSHSFFLTQILNDLKDEKNMGDSVVTTLDYDVQKAAYKALGDNDGAVVVIEPKTGRVLAMVSKPDYNPNTLSDKWDSIVSDNESSVLLNRATSGLYPPGSTFKILTTLEYIHENTDYSDYTYDCDGSITVDGVTIHCYGNESHGNETLLSSFANSCNSSYANIGLTLNLTKFGKLANKMLFNQTLPTASSIETKESSFSLKADSGTDEIMETSIGQGDTLVTPIHMAMIASAIDNNGVLMKPYLVDHIQNDAGAVLTQYSESTYGSVMSASDAQIMQQFMSEVVQSGTAHALRGQSYTASGKTGSAEYNSKGDSHGWFVGYASQNGKNDIAIAVIVENGGSGSKSAVPVAKKVFNAYFD